MFEDLNVKGMQKFNGNMFADNVMGIITRVMPKSQQKSAIKTKVFNLSQFVVGYEKKYAA